MDQIILMDPQTVRSLSSVLNVAAVAVVKLIKKKTGLLDDNLDDLFGDDSASYEVEKDADILNDLTSDLNKEEGHVNTDDSEGDWHFILIRINGSIPAGKLQSRLNDLLGPFELSVVDWRTAAGNTALMVLLVKQLFYGGVFLIVLAGIISIVNIVLISVFRKTREIGTLRAIGAGDRFILSSIMLENLMVSVFAGALGILLAVLLIQTLNHMSVPIGNGIIAALLGNSVLYIDHDAEAVVEGFLLAVILGLASSIYPGLKAVFINPIEAVRRD